MENLNKTAPTKLPPNANLFSKEEEEFPVQAMPEQSKVNTFSQPFPTVSQPIRTLPEGEELPLLEELGIDI
jgi:hypothetical protein